MARAVARASATATPPLMAEAVACTAGRGEAGRLVQGEQGGVAACSHGTTQQHTHMPATHLCQGEGGAGVAAGIGVGGGLGHSHTVAGGKGVGGGVGNGDGVSAGKRAGAGLGDGGSATQAGGVGLAVGDGGAVALCLSVGVGCGQGAVAHLQSRRGQGGARAQLPGLCSKHPCLHASSCPPSRLTAVASLLAMAVPWPVAAALELA